MLVALLPLALAGPARCVASWTGPAAGCALRGELTASAAGPSEKAAERAVQRQLAKVTELAVAAHRARIPTLGPESFTSCAATVKEDAHVNCFPDEDLAEEGLCFVELADPECWTGQVRQVEGVGWQVLGAGRDALCRAVDERLVEQNYTDVATRRAVCAASCAAKTTVRCLTEP